MIGDLLTNNRRWAAQRWLGESERFVAPTTRQTPRCLWIGCSDSRTPAHEMVGLEPGEVFVHRNVANLAPRQDAKFVSALRFAVDVVQVDDVIVCGHYGCGGVRAALSSERRGLMDHWLRPVRTLGQRRAAEFDSISEAGARFADACEHNVREQVAGLAENPCVVDAWRRGRPLLLHGWIYSDQDGLLHDLAASDFDS